MDEQNRKKSGRDSTVRTDILRPRRTEARGYLMIESAEIQNFRAFKFTQLSGLSRVNVVVGDNGVGKTALLEALFLGAAPNPDVAVRFRVWRGADAPGATGTAQEISDGLFQDLFFNMTKDVVPTIDLHGTANDSRSLRLYYDASEPTLLSLVDQSQRQSSAYTPVTFEWKDAEGQITKLTPRVQAGGLAIPPITPLTHDPAFIAARAAFPTLQNARWFSDFSKRGRETKFISALQAQFDYLKSLTVEVDLGSPVLFVKVPWLDSKMPIYLASDGLNKLMTLLLHIAHSEHTAVFVDEIENGFHYGRYGKLWEQLLSFAEEYETQLFISTHSWEFLKAGAPLIEKFHDDFSLIQVFQENGISDAVVVPGRSAGAAIAAGIDVRPSRRNDD